MERARGTGSRRRRRDKWTRGGGARNATDLSSSPPKVVLHMEDLAQGEPLETPLTMKRRRRYSPPVQSSATMSSTKTRALTPNVNATLDAEESTLIVLDTSAAPEADASIPGTSASPGPAESLLEFHTPPSPTVIFEIFENNHWMTLKPNTRDSKTDQQFFGSESEDSDSSDDDESGLPSYAVRGLMALEDTPLDEILPFKTEPVDSFAKEPDMVYRPSDLYDFEWREHPDPPIPPESRRETFSQKNVGPKVKYNTPYDAFIAIWDSKIMEHIAEQTNLYAQQFAAHKMDTNDLTVHSRIAKWADVTIDELYVYFGILLAMGVVVKSRIIEYWDRSQTIFETPGFNALMPLKRFQLLNKCIHFNDNAVMYAQSLDITAAKLFKIQPILTHLNQKFQKLYNLNQNLVLDQSLLQWKGWLDINQFIPNKVASVGIKTYEVCESQTGYLWRFEVHTYKKIHLPQQQSDPLQASTPAIVLKLLEGLEHKGHTVWMDNFYNSPALARKLKTLGFDCVGTLRTNRQFVPEALTKLDMHPGQITGCTSGDVDLIVWRERNRVATISTYHGNTTMTTNGKFKPIVIQDYNLMMRGVDKKDQMLAMYPMERKRCQVWYKKLFRRLLNVSVLNSYILFRQSVLPKKCKHRDFRMSLINCILSTHQTTGPLPRILQEKALILLVKDHHLAQMGCNPGTNRHQRLKCIVCKKRVSLYCVGCQKTFCMDPCFVDAHQSPDILNKVTRPRLALQEKQFIPYTG